MKLSIILLHRTFAKLSKTAKYDRIYHVIKEMSPIISTFLKQNAVTGENPKKTAYEIFKLLRSHTRVTIIKICEDCLKRKSPRYKTLFSYISLPSENSLEDVNPVNSDLLTINYESRPLEAYDEKP